MSMHEPIPVVDVFAGPGGLNEGFSSITHPSGAKMFQTVASFEVESNAVETLKLRAALRRIRDENGEFPKIYYRFLNGEIDSSALSQDPQMAKALDAVGSHEVFQIRLGEPTRSEVDEILSARLSKNRPSILIGGPPCQAYSLAGRSRRIHDETFSEDEKHLLYREYLHIVEAFTPTIFVMENVKGLLTSKHADGSMFDKIISDLSMKGQYSIHSLVAESDELKPRDFVVHAEEFGVPQARHRVILLGIRVDSGLQPMILPHIHGRATVRNAIFDLPPVRSTVSPIKDDSEVLWEAQRETGRAYARVVGASRRVPPLGAPFLDYSPKFGPHDTALWSWLRDSRLRKISLHEPRGHMLSDLQRYEFMALSPSLDGRLRTVKDFPPALLPNHGNLRRTDTPFVDRFRVQGWDSPSSTVTSHIAKDGHHFIHPDASQMRSLTVREAARLQTFPDDYYFVGNRTAKYHQVGNAVPPFLARQIGQVVADILARGAG